MSALTDWMQAIGAVLAAPASIITAVMMRFQWLTGRDKWAPSIEVSYKNKSPLHGEMTVTVINKGPNIAVITNARIISPESLKLVPPSAGYDDARSSIPLRFEVPPGSSSLVIRASVDETRLSGLKLHASFTATLKSDERRHKEIAVFMTIH